MTGDPTPAYYQVAETNRQSLNLGPALIRRTSSDVRFIVGRHNGQDNALPGRRVDSARFCYGGADWLDGLRGRCLVATPRGNSMQGDRLLTTAQILRGKLIESQPTVGVLITLHLWPSLIEHLVQAGMDYAIIDREHGSFSDDVVAETCTLARLMNFPVLIRPLETTCAQVRFAADQGACGFLLPQVEDVSMMDAVRDALHMPPRGRRRPGGPGNAWLKNFNYADWKNGIEDLFVVMPQIESRRGLANVDAIASHELTTAVAVGPYDLSADIGVCYDPKARALEQALARIRAAAKQVGKPAWGIGAAADLLAAGYNFICIGEPTMLLTRELQSQVARIKH